MRKAIIASAVATLFAMPTLVSAQAAAPTPEHTFTGNATIATQYIFRGLTQTNGKPALQGGADYSHSSGLYAGTWASNISWFTDQNVGTTTPWVPRSLGGPQGLAGSTFNATGGNTASLEWDFYAGYKNTFGGGDWNYDIGLLQYWYPGTYDNLGTYFSKPNTLEAYGALGWKWVSLKYSHSLSDTFGVKNSRGSSYLDLSAAIPLGESGFTLGLHAGHQKFKGTSPVLDFTFTAGNHSFTNNLFSYTDYKVSLSKEWFGINWTAAATGTNAKGRASGFNGVDGAVYENIHRNNTGDSAFTISATKSF